MRSFAQKGQGPGEIENPAYLRIDFNDQLVIIDTGGHKHSIFDTEGILIKEFPIDMNIARPGTAIIPLENGNYVVRSIERTYFCREWATRL
jgi:hypothetical protein